MLFTLCLMLCRTCVVSVVFFFLVTIHSFRSRTRIVLVFRLYNKYIALYSYPMQILVYYPFRLYPHSIPM